MSKCRPKNQQLIENITKAINKRFNYIYTSDLSVCYDASEFNKRDYTLVMIVGEVWDRYDTEMLRKIIRENGGTNIIGGCYKYKFKTRDKYISMAFDEKIRK